MWCQTHQIQNKWVSTHIVTVWIKRTGQLPSTSVGTEWALHLQINTKLNTSVPLISVLVTRQGTTGVNSNEKIISI